MNHDYPTLAACTVVNSSQAAAPQRQPLPLRRLLRAYVMEAGFETLAALRTTGLAIPFIVVPVLIYLVFGVVIAGDAAANSELGPALADYLFAGFLVLAVAMPGIFSGALLATERDGKLLLLKRAMPLPPGANIIAKVVMTLCMAAIAAALVVITALIAGKITLSASQLLIMFAVMLVGAIPFCAIGLLIGTLVSGSAAPAWCNLVFLPMLWLSGLFIPLPAFLQPWVVIWPSFHLNQVAMGLAGIEQFSYIPATMAAAVLLGLTVLCGGLAIRRLARVG